MSMSATVNATTATAGVKGREWISGRQARMILGCGYPELMKFAALGLVRTRAEMGTAIKFHAASVASLAAKRAEAGE